jgi:hypothetical protein
MTPENTEPKASFIHGTLSKRFAVQTLFYSQIQGRVTEALTAFDKYIAYLENITQLGTAVTLNKTGKLRLSKDDFKEHLGADVFGELEAMANKGRAYLADLGFVSKVTVAPAAILKGNDDGSAGIVTPYQVENPGEPPLQGMKVTALAKDENPTAENP